ncbi:MAG: glycerate kinase [Candidatus Cryptobacteroides sp.]
MSKIVIASDSFKGSLSSLQVAESAALGIVGVLPGCEIVKVGIADGGEGTVDAVVRGTGGRFIRKSVMNPLMRPVEAVYGILPDGETAVIEAAAASGLTLLDPSERNPLLTTTYGTGELIMDALSGGCRRFVIGIGGSATNDGGTGMLSALGFRFLDSCGNVLDGVGGNLGKIVSVDASEVPACVRDAVFTVACDVDTPFCGPVGAARVFAPQKGASPEMVEMLDEGMRSFACVIRDFLGTDVASCPGAGAAGGLGGAFKAFLGAELRSGVDMVLDAVGFDRLLEGADLVITGEGKIDSQTAKGKAPSGVLKRAAAKGIPVVAIGGLVVRDSVPDGFAAVFQVTPQDMPLSEAMRQETASQNVSRTVRGIIKDMI